MDLSINNINLKNKNINFKGLDGAYNKNTVPVYKFYAPAHSSEEKVYLEIAVLYKDEKTGQYLPPKRTQIQSAPFQNDVLEIPQENIQKLSSGFAYRYRIEDNKGNIKRYELDPFKSMAISEKGKKPSERMNVIEQSNFYGISPKGGTMRHSFLDSDVRLNNEGKKAALNQEFVRNHFNKLGGSIKGLNWLLTETDELAPYRYIMTTPDIGVDKVSSHKYWPSNQYQCSDLETFKDFNFELFKQGKGYIADGAFTSQGIQSPLVQHVLKWGEKSPFYNMLKIDGDIVLGILPDKEEITNKHVGVRLINPKGKDYDKSKPTYIQFYDDRLLKPESQNDGKPHFDYDNSPKDIYEITSHQDSIQPYAFEIDPNDKKLKAFEGKNCALLKNILKKNPYFLTFENFSIGTKSEVSGVTCWDGNVDIIKMNLSNPSCDPKNKEGFFEARDYLLGVASYWSDTIQSHLILKTAQQGEDGFEAIAEANDVSNLGEIRDSIEYGKFASRIANQSFETKDLIKKFPLQTLETSEELSAIFSQKEFRDEFFSNEVLNKIAGIFDNTIEQALVDKKDFANDKAKENYIKYVKKTYGNEILRQIFISALKPDSINQNGNQRGTIDLNKLHKVTLKSLESYSSLSPEEERKQVISKLKRGLNQANLSPLQGRMKDELGSISLKDFQIAEALVLQGKGGLNWRFDAAKDIGDLDAVRNGTKTFNKIWNGDSMTPGVQKFWSDFVSRIKEYNPSAYIINEVTSLGEFCNVDNEDSMHKFDPQLTAAWVEQGKPGNYDEKPVYAKQVQFLNETGSTTTSEYSKGFNSFSEFAGVNPEKPVDISSKAGNLSNLKNQMESLMKYNQPNSAIFSHMFVSNHDKPSILHTMPINMSIYLSQNLKESIAQLNDKDNKIVARLLGEGYSLDNVSSKALAVGMAMLKTISALDKEKFSTKDKIDMEKILQNLVLGKKDDNSPRNFKRAEAFSVKPYEVTIKDLIQKAGIAKNSDDLIEKTREFHHTMMESSMEYYKRLWEIMNACVGTPTLYGGNEFVQTGYETPSKNEYLGIRNEVIHDLKNDERYEDYYKKMHKISGMYKLPGLSVLRDGTPISLSLATELEEYYAKAEKEGVNRGAMEYFIKQVKASGKKFEIGDSLTAKDFGIGEEYGNHDKFRKVKNIVYKAAKQPTSGFEYWPIYRKNAKGEQAISVLTNIGLPIGVASCDKIADSKASRALKSISIKDSEGKCPFKDGTELERIDYKGNKEPGFIVRNGSIERRNEEEFYLIDTVSVFIPKKK